MLINCKQGLQHNYYKNIKPAVSATWGKLIGLIQGWKTPVGLKRNEAVLFRRQPHPYMKSVSLDYFTPSDLRVSKSSDPIGRPLSFWYLIRAALVSAPNTLSTPAAPTL